MLKQNITIFFITQMYKYKFIQKYYCVVYKIFIHLCSMRTSLKRLLTFFLQGVLVVAPVVVTVYLIYWLFSSIDNLLPIFTTQDRFGNTVSHNKGLGFVIIIVALIIIAGLGIIIGFYRWNQIKIKQQRKEAEMSQTLLRAQMNPHFIFNAMSVIQSYIYENDTVNSSKFLVNFSRLMRLILENSSKEFIPLETEIEILEKYLAMQKLRFEERFEYDIKIEENINNDFTVIPPMITQPFIENAIEHGQLHTIEGGFISVSFKKTNDMLSIHIEDNGIGRKGSLTNKKSKAHKSMAMQITRERIDNLNKKYKTSGSLDIEDFNKTLETGTKVLILLPLREEKPNS